MIFQQYSIKCISTIEILIKIDRNKGELRIYALVNHATLRWT